MLSVVPIKESSISSSYYLKQDGGYYIENSKDKELYQWFGKGCVYLGLIGEVNPHQHADIYSGKLPNGEIIGKKMPDGSIKGRPGYDLTFSMNKDISLIICASENKELSNYFLSAHLNAVKTALFEIEKKVQARKTLSGKTEFETTKNMVSSLCTHFSSRAGDAEVHTHVLIANATKRSDGKWRALATDMSRKNGFFEMVRDNAVLYGSIYQNEIAVACVQKGFEVERIHKNGMFKITGFPDDLRENFSKRRKQIEGIIDTMNPAVKNNKKVYDKVAQHSKSSKENTNRDDFFKKAKEEVKLFLNEKNYQKSFDSIVTDCATKQKNLANDTLISRLTAREAIDDAMSYLSKFSITLDANKILNKAILLDLGLNSYKDIYIAFEESIKSKKLISLENGLYITSDLVQREKNFIEQVEKINKISDQKAFINETSKNDFIKNINDSISKSRFCFVEDSLKQNEKNDFLSDLVKDLEKNKKTVKVISINKSSANTYSDHYKKINRPASIWERLKNIGREDIAVNMHTFLSEYAYESNLPLNKLFSTKGKEVFIVDDAQKMSFDSISRLMDISHEKNARIIFLKNDYGTKSILSGNAISLIEKCKIPTVKLSSKKLPESHKDKLKNNINESIRIVDSPKYGSRNENDSFRFHHITDKIIDENQKMIMNVAILVPSKKIAEKVNLQIRDEFVKKGLIGNENKNITISESVHLEKEEQKHAKFYPVGSIIKSYIGRGQYKTNTIIRHDLSNNKLVTQTSSGKIEIFLPKDVLKSISDNHSVVVNEKTIPLSRSDIVRITKSNRYTDQIGIKIDHSYKVISIDDKHTSFHSNENKIIKIKNTNLNGLFLKYDYARSIHDSKYQNKKSAICEIPSYLINSNLLSDLKKQYSDIEIFTDNVDKAQKKISFIQKNQNAIDLEIKNIAPEKSMVARAVDYAIDVVNSREAAFSLEEILKKSLSYKLANTNFKSIKSELFDRVKSGDLQCRVDQNQVMFATKETIALENKIINKISLGHNKFDQLIDPIKSKEYLQSTNLTKGQQSACHLIATTKDQFVMVQGYAGTGKSTMLQTLIGDRTLDTLTALLPEHIEILAVAPTHQATSELEKRGIRSQTIKSLLVDYKKDEIKFDTNNQTNKLVIVDESSMISNKDFHVLQLVVEKINAKCVYLGDIAQLSAVEAGKPSELAYIAKESNIATAVMSENLRQTDEKLKSIANLLMDGGSDNFRKAFDVLEKNNFVIETSPDKNDISDESSHINSIANYYVSIPKDKRVDTLIAASSNTDRISVNEEIRSLLIKHGDISDENLRFMILDDSRLTDAELKHSENYKPGMIVKFDGLYKTVIQSDKFNNTITLLDHDNNTSLLALSHLPENSFIELYTERSINLSTNDVIKFTKTDNDKGFKANQILKIVSIDMKTGVISAMNSKDEIHKINPTDYTFKHIDHGYCSTTHGLQGATSKNILILLSSYNKKLNTMKQLYVSVTRARESALIFTDNSKDIKNQIINNIGEKLSALEAMKLLKKKEVAFEKNKNVVNQENLSNSHNNSQKIYLDAKEVENNLKIHVKSVVSKILGEPNHTLSTSKNWRYGAHGSLSVMVDGEKSGVFHNFETGEKGGIIALIMHEFGLSFKDALEHASKFLGSKSHLLSQLERKNQKNSQVIQKTPENKNKQKHIDLLIQKSKPIDATLAEKYLKNRSILDVKNSDLRFLESVTTGSGNKNITPISPALMTIARDENGKPHSVQLTYLDKNTGNKLVGIPIAKRTLNSLNGSYVNLTKDVKNPDITFVAEGVETALSIRDSTKAVMNAQVIASLGKSNLPNLNTAKLANQIILVLDNDLKNPFDDSSVRKAIDAFEKSGRSVICIFPEAINNRKTDYNDLAQAQKYNQISRDIEIAVSGLKSNDFGVTKTNGKEQYVDMEKEFLG